ncbi:hypothetical protein NI454_00970 [Brevundimonas diminuta]|uniref:hypothetical protein n=1 Tax=Brevundimonas diminuta TaxID=293 RepID=UPI0020983EAD|nr:hypothetical protein [Brevundimonas diminuta]MCO8028515.1 hypothetical protein [Brevundimonas diminuta]
MIRSVFAAVCFWALFAAGEAFGQPVSDRSEARAEQDLSAQLGMQVAAEKMVDLTRWQIFFSALATGGLLLTLTMTRASLKMTKTALEHTETSMQITRDNAQKELRAYIGFESCEFIDVNGAPRIAYKFANKGVTPAIDVRWCSSATILLGLHRAYPVEAPDQGGMIMMGDVEPQVPKPFILELEDPQFDEHWDSIQDGRRCIHFYIVVRYKDVFGQHHECTVRDIRFGPRLSRGWHNQHPLAV